MVDCPSISVGAWYGTGAVLAGWNVIARGGDLARHEADLDLEKIENRQHGPGEE